MSFSRGQWLTLAAGVIVFFLLFFINRKQPLHGPLSAMADDKHAGAEKSFDEIVNAGGDTVPVPIMNKVNELTGMMNGGEGKDVSKIADEIIRIYDSCGAFIKASLYMEKMGSRLNSPSYWNEAGERYYNYASAAKPEYKNALLSESKKCFNSALLLDSNNADAIVGSGKCIVEEGQNPMQGIGMIEKVIQKDSDNEKAQLALGIFSIKSAQYTKAIYRLNKVLQINPSFNEAYIYLAEVYESMGDKKVAVEKLKKYCSTIKDTVILNSIHQYIHKLEQG